MIAVLAGSKKQFDNFIKPWVTYRDECKFRYVSRMSDVRGVEFTDYIRIGTFYTNPIDYKLVEEIERRIKFKDKIVRAI